MELNGRLKDDLLNGNTVLFLGAGASQAAGYKGNHKFLIDKNFLDVILESQTSFACD